MKELFTKGLFLLVLAFTVTVHAQEINVTGMVTDSNTGIPIPGVNVVEKNTNNGAATDFDGNYSIRTTIGNVLVFSYLGYQTQEITVSDQRVIDISLTEDAALLDEVVVVGYSTQKRESVTGALQTVTGEDLRNITTPSVENMLTGKAPGVYVAPGSGQPGSRGGVVIRGQATLSGTTSPLWVIDGVVVGSGAGELNPDDIDSITILKDAASTSIYGSQGANGVIVVTTKRGKVGKTTVDISSKIGFNQLNNGNTRMMTGAELYDSYAAFSNADQIAFPRWSPDLRNSNFDWWDLATKSGFTRNYNISLQGGTETLRSFMSVGLYDEQGAVKGYDYTRYNFRFKTEYKPLKWLTIKPALVGSFRDVEDRQYSTTAMYSNLPWDSPFDEDGNLVPHRYSGWVNSASTNYLYDLLPGFEVLDVVARPERTKGAINEWAVQSVLFNANYAYNNKYMAQVSFRRDGASNFGDNAKYGNFFSVSAGWNIDREAWFKADWVDALKLRVAYGSVGNRPSSLYPQYDLYAVSTGAGYDENPGALISQIGNKDLTWEKTYTSGIGLDASLFDNRVRFTFDYYIKNTDNILYQVPITGLTGVTSIWQNIGEMENKGIELAIGGDIIRTNDLTWSVDVNLGHNANKLTKLYKTKDASGDYVVRPIIVGDGLGIAGSAQRMLEPGRPVDTYYLREWAGVNPDNGLPMWYQVERDSEGNELSRATTSNYSEATFEKTGKVSPDLFGGFSTALYYKRFDLGAVFGYAIGGKIYNYSRQEYDADGTYTDRNQMSLRPGWSRWEKPGDIATHPIARYNNQDKGNSPSTRYLEKSDFLKMRSLSLGYNLDLSQYKIDNLRISLTGENLFVITDYSGVDPEIPVNDSGAIMGSTGPAVYPSTRKFMLGLNLKF